jgi:hypothetical protein
MTEKQATKYRYVKEKVESSFYYVLFLIICPIIFLYFHLQDRDNILNSFNSNKELVCKVASTKINVSKKDNWIYEDYHFIKGESKIITTKCEEK